MPMSTKRSNFYTEVYFPSVYYKEVFATTLEDAKSIQEAQAQLNKLLIDADSNLAKLSETFRERALSPSQQLQLQADQQLLAGEAAARGGAAQFAQSMRTNPVVALNLQEKIANAKIGEGGQTPTDADTAKRALTTIYREASKYTTSNPAMARRIMVDGLRNAEQQGIKFGSVATEVNQRVQAIAGQGVTRADLATKVGSTEDRAQIGAFTGGATAPPSPAAQEAQFRLNAMASPFANASTEQTAHIAAGISDTDDELLRLYLSRLQDSDTPGVVSEAELAANPALIEAEQVYQRVRADSSYQKSAAEWFSSEYLSALTTKSNLEQQASKDPFGGLDPYRWAQRQAFDRGGYTKESVIYLRMLSERPELAPYVTPAFERLRDPKGIDPQNAAEAVIRAAYEQNPKLTVAELDTLLADKRAALAKSGRQAARQAGALTEEGRTERRAGRQVGRELYGTPAAADDAKAYLIALRLNASGTQATPTTGKEIVAPAPPTPPAAPAETASIAASKAALAARQAAQPPAPAPSVDTAGIESQIDQYLQDRARTALPPAQQQFLAAVPGTEPAPLARAAGEPAGSPTPAVFAEPGTDYTYQRTPEGDYIVLRRGVRTGIATAGSRAAQSIERVMAGQAPLPTLAPAAPVAARKTAPAPTAAPAPAASTPAPVAPTPELYEARAQAETDPERQRVLRAAAQQMRARQAPPAPVPRAAAPAPAPINKPLTPEQLEALYGG